MTELHGVDPATWTCVETRRVEIADVPAIKAVRLILEATADLDDPQVTADELHVIVSGRRAMNIAEIQAAKIARARAQRQAAWSYAFPGDPLPDDPPA